MNNANERRKRGVARRHLKKELTAMRDSLVRQKPRFFQTWLNKREGIRLLNRILRDI